MCEYEFFQQDDANIVTANNLVSALQSFLGQQMISRLLWPALLSELNSYYYCEHILWGSLTKKERKKTDKKFPHTNRKEELEKIVRHTLSDISKHSQTDLAGSVSLKS